MVEVADALAVAVAVALAVAEPFWPAGQEALAVAVAVAVAVALAVKLVGEVEQFTLARKLTNSVVEPAILPMLTPLVIVSGRVLITLPLPSYKVVVPFSRLRLPPLGKLTVTLPLVPAAAPSAGTAVTLPFAKLALSWMFVRPPKAALCSITLY
jgi:hypothetical protein